MIKLPNQEPPMGSMPPMPMAPEPPMGDPNMEDPNMGGDPNAMENDPMAGDPNMEDPNMGGENSGANQELIDVISQLGLEDQNAVLKYAKSMTDDSSNEQPQNDIPVESRFFSKRIVNEIMQDLVGDNDAKRVRDKKEIPDEMKYKNPFVYGI